MKKLTIFIMILSLMALALTACGGSHTVIFEVEGEKYAEATVNDGEVLDLPAPPVREGYVFLGWTLDGEDFDAASPIGADLTLVGKFIDEPTYLFGDDFEYELSEDGTYYTILSIGGYKNKDVIIPESYNNLPVLKIADGAFRATDITSVTIPKGLSSIGEGAFGECASLATITTDSESTAFTVYEGVLYTKDEKTLIAYPQASKAEALTVRDGVTRIGSYAFARATSLTSVTLPDTLEDIGEYSFYSCTSLKAVNISQDSKLKTIGVSAFSSNNLLEAISIPNGVRKIEMLAFYGCTSLQEVNFGKGSQLCEIGDFAFSLCTSLTDFNYDGTKDKLELYVSVGEGNEAITDKDFTAGIGSYTQPDGAWVPSVEYEGITYATWASEGDYLAGLAPVTWYDTEIMASADVGATDTIGNLYRDPNYIPGYVHIFKDVKMAKDQVTFGQTQKVVVNLGGNSVLVEKGFRVGGTDGSRKEASVTLKNGQLRHTAGQIQPRADSTMIYENMVINFDRSDDIFYGLCCELAVFRNCEIYINGGGGFMICGRWTYEKGERNTLRFENTDLILAGQKPKDAFMRINENKVYDSHWDIIFDGESSISGDFGCLLQLKEVRSGNNIYSFKTVQNVIFEDGFIFRGGATPFTDYKLIAEDREDEITLPVEVRPAGDDYVNFTYGDVIVIE